MPTFLIVDDSATARKVVRERLGNIGYGATVFLEAGNGIEALGFLRSVSIDLLFTDIDMPQMDGTSLISEVKNQRIWRKIPIIVVSAMEDRRKEEVFKLGVNRVIYKPPFEDDLREAVEHCLAIKSGMG